MKIGFTKMHGSGNDFVVIDNLEGGREIGPEQVVRLCHRRFGIGADGVLLLEEPGDTGLDARMVYYNADGSRGEMCGNGARCFTAFALSRGLGSGKELRFMTDAGALTAAVTNGRYTIQMRPPGDTKLDRTLELANGPATVHYTNTGVPHAVRFVDDIEAVDIRREGAELRYHAAFAPKGANANFVEIRDDGTLLIRTYERGVEDETLACGTGVTAAGIVAHLIRGVPGPVQVNVRSGDTLTVDFTVKGQREVENVLMTGPAATVFTGTIELAGKVTTG